VGGVAVIKKLTRVRKNDVARDWGGNSEGRVPKEI